MEIRRENKGIFDIKPMDKSGVIELDLSSVVKLKKQPKQKLRSVSHVQELEKILNDNLNFKTELINAGASINEVIPPNEAIQPQPPNQPQPQEIDFDKVLSEINRSSLRLKPEEYPHQQTKYEIKEERRIKQVNEVVQTQGRSFPKKLLLIPILLAIGFFAWKYGSAVKDDIVQNGNSAVANLEQAKTNLEHLNFKEALRNFSAAHDDFSQASDSLNLMGNFMSGVLGQIPGNNQYNSARNLVEAGKLLSQSGRSLISAVDHISKTGSILDPSNSRSDAVINLKRALFAAQANMRKASGLLAEVDSSIIPEDKRPAFIEFKQKMPEMESLIEKGLDYSMFLESLIAINGSKQYLVLFQNPSELRPTGGFPGSYGILRFQNGSLEEFKVDDVYNLDGQIKENIIPPKEMQHITPTWGMRDANWFIDFPTSAKKTLEFFRKEAGYGVDGVITFNPLIVGKILEIIGPVELPEYEMVLDKDNFLVEIQAEVEYGENRTQPKTVLFHFAPRLLEKIYSANSDKWLEIVNAFTSSLENKDIMMYFSDPSLQNFIVDQNFSGEIKNIADSDYLYANITNIKGSKTDIVTDTSIKIDVQVMDGQALHRVHITRQHKGGKEKYGFYNKANSAYLRVLVPENAEFVGISGNSLVNYTPLINYVTAKFNTFIEDPDLKKFESNFVKIKEDVFRYTESGKKGFSFWMIVEPGNEKTVVLEYKTPVASDPYKLYIQKQPGLEVKNFEATLDIDGRTTTKSLPMNSDLDLYVDVNSLNE